MSKYYRRGNKTYGINEQLLLVTNSNDYKYGVNDQVKGLFNNI